MEGEFAREPRYAVFKIADIKAYLTRVEIESVLRIGEDIAESRKGDGRPPFNAVVVEQDWPEFDLVWQMIEARMTGHGNDSRRMLACANACDGVTDEQFAGGWTAKGLSEYAKRLEQQRGELLTALKRAVDWAKPMEEAPQGARPEWFDIARTAIASVKGGA